MFQIFRFPLIIRNPTSHRSSSRLPFKAATTKIESSSKELKNQQHTSVDLIEAVAVPVKNAPTLDATWRSPNSIQSPKEKMILKQKVQKMPWNITPDPDIKNLFQHYKKLSKFRLTSLVVLTSMTGYAMAPALFDLTTFCLCSLGTGLVSAAANTINQYHEVPFDSQMSRTKNRVLVTGSLTPTHAVGFAIVTAATGLGALYFGVNGLTASLAAGNLFLYTSVYTPAKRFTIANTWIGSIVGAIPPLMGWAGCCGTLDSGAWILAGLLYAWQFPHFNALSWNLRPEYSRAGYRLMVVTNPSLCRRTALRYTLAITALSMAAPFFDVTNIWFALESFPLNAYFCYMAWKFYQKSDSSTSRKLFRFSLVHLPLLMLLFLLNKKRWYFTEQVSSSEEISSLDKLPVIGVAGSESMPSKLISSLPAATISAQAKTFDNNPLVGKNVGQTLNLTSSVK